MPFHFWWRPNNRPVSQGGGRINIGLDLGGDIDPRDPSIDFQLKILSWPAQGYIYLCEVGGEQAGRGARESSQGRIICAFHGSYYLNRTAPENNRITFALETDRGLTNPYEGDVVGFDPDCIYGVDAFVFTFVNREFHVNLPYYIDTQSEGDYMEIKAVARVQSTSRTLVLGESAVLRLPIRRRHLVITTTQAGRSYIRYTGNLIGHLICHHEKYLLFGAYKNRRSSWPRGILSPRMIEVPWRGENYAIPFENYSSGSMKILLLDELADNCVPDADSLASNVTGGAMNGPALRNRCISRFKQRTVSEIVHIFEDAGFTGAHVWWQSDQQATGLVQQFNQKFQQARNAWTLINSQQTLSIPFWTFIAVNNSRITEVGHSESTEIEHVTSSEQTGNREYKLPYPTPIGSGNKNLNDPINLRCSFFAADFTSRTYNSEQALDQRTDLISAKFAVTVAHEIGHSLGLMHPAAVQPIGTVPYSENLASPLFTIMCSRVDSGAYGSGMRFSSQDKVIWERAFGIHPNYNTPGQQEGCHFRNKTWSDWRNTDWSERRGLMMRQFGESSVFVLDLRTGQSPPPYAGTDENIQRGTHL